MTLQYTLKFYDYWHISSGLSAGTRLDSTVIKDDNNLPYVAGKTIKGLSREMAELLEDAQFVKECFGGEGIDIGKCYFANAVLKQETAKQIISNKLQDSLCDILAFTKIDDKTGIADDKTLREIEVVVPLTLTGEIKDIPNQDYFNKLIKALKMIKRIGLNRNRGLGRCEFIVEVSK
ncbi:MAG: hypothetical protein RL154_64 [Pseudomonadota bacterium]|jgi:CRISPR/Cas system CSM-associated protein Csm3 (group 7 of RAMP superfamily)